MRTAHLAAISSAVWFCALALSSAQTVDNGSFETPAQPSDSFAYDPSGAGWTFTNFAGIINAPGGGFFGQNAPDGNQYAFLQSSTAPGSIAKSITFSLSGTYQLPYLIAGRRDNGGGALGNLTYDIVLDSNLIGSDSTTSGQAFTARSFEFSVGSGVHTLTFEALPSKSNGDDTGFIDLVAIQPVPEPDTTALLMIALAVIGLRRRWKRGASW
ncbi:MAG TPA: PEP-CTERM sorting domain-containing protein [Chthoniobacterales bacterium]|nr:PEP-CTERM sorting domain-containing protein [Chthoniobacterales bacterium]